MTAGLFGRQVGSKLSTLARTISLMWRITFGQGLPDAFQEKTKQEKQPDTTVSGDSPTS